MTHVDLATLADMRVLVVEDDPKLGPVLVRGFATDSIAADLVTSGRDAIVRAGATEYAVIVLDVMLPDMDGFQVCRELRDDDTLAPVLMLTARDAVRDRVHGLDSGADDYLVKPFSFDELLARVRAMSRRGPIERKVMLEAGDLRLDSARHQVWRGEVPIDLSRTEYAILEALMRHPGRRAVALRPARAGLGVRLREPFEHRRGLRPLCTGEGGPPVRAQQHPDGERSRLPLVRRGITPDYQPADLKRWLRRRADPLAADADVRRGDGGAARRR